MSYQTIIAFLVSSIFVLGYPGIFILMFLESSFFPFPSEVVIIPAGFLAFQGKLNLFLIIIIGILGSLAGAWFNYLLASIFGRQVLLKFIKQHHLARVENFFAKHGHISTFNGRLIPIIRQYISFPAGLARMNPWKFTIYTILGASIWVVVLAMLGYFLGQNQALIHSYLQEITFLTLGIVLLISTVYIYFKKKKK